MKAFAGFKKGAFKDFSDEYIGYAALCEGGKKYSAVITGSDQLWSPAGLPTNYYNLMFVPDDTLKISIASSFGVKEIPWYQKKRTDQYLNTVLKEIRKSCMAGFVLKNTLSDNGGVTRGICKMDDQNNLTEVVETKNIVKTATGAETDGVSVDVDSLVSMNMWGLTPDFLDVLEEGFKEFFEKEVPGNPLKAEYLIPIFIGELLDQGKMSVKVLKTNDTWYGMTYHEDVSAVKDSFKKMLENGVYKADLFSDL